MVEIIYIIAILAFILSSCGERYAPEDLEKYLSFCNGHGGTLYVEITTPFRNDGSIKCNDKSTILIGELE